MPLLCLRIVKLLKICYAAGRSGIDISTYLYSWNKRQQTVKFMGYCEHSLLILLITFVIRGVRYKFGKGDEFGSFFFNHFEET